MQTGPPDINLQSTSSKGIPITVWVVLALLYAEPIVRGQWDVVVDYAPGIALIAWLLFVLFWAPGITVRTDSATVRNVWRSTMLPYPRIDRVVIAAMVRVHYTDADGSEHKVTSWGAPGLPKLRRGFSRRAPGTPLPQYAGQSPEDSVMGESQVLVERWNQRKDVRSDEAVTRTWHIPTIIITAAVGAWAAWSLLT